MQFPFPTTPAEAGKGRLVGFLSAQPGAGSAILACLTALANEGETALIDLNPASKVRTYMGLTSDVCPASVLDLAGVASPEDVSRAGAEHPRNVFVVPGVVRPLDAAQITSRLAIKALTLLKKRFPFTVVVLDSLWASGWAGAMLCDVVCLVLRPDRADLDAFGEQADLLARLGCGERLKVILNQAGAPGGLRETEVKSAVKPDAIISYDPALRAACNRRYPEPGKVGKIISDLIAEGR